MRGLHITATLVLAATLTACATPAPKAPVTALESSPKQSGSNTPTKLSVPPQERPGHENPVDTLPTAKWNAESEADAIDTAESAMYAYARPHLDHDTWWKELAPFLNDTALADYAWLQPAAIPATAVTGSGHTSDTGTALLAQVTVPTNAGEYDVLLNRADGQAPWRVVRFTPPVAQ